MALLSLDLCSKPFTGSTNSSRIQKLPSVCVKPASIQLQMPEMSLQQMRILHANLLILPFHCKIAASLKLFLYAGSAVIGVEPFVLEHSQGCRRVPSRGKVRHTLLLRQDPCTRGTSAPTANGVLCSWCPRQGPNIGARNAQVVSRFDLEHLIPPLPLLSRQPIRVPSRCKSGIVGNGCQSSSAASSSLLNFA